MRSLFIIFFLTISSLFAQQQVDSVGFYVKIGDPSPEFTLTFPNGDSTSFSELKGKVIMLQFTASWCSVCRQEIPHIEQKIWQDLKCDELIVIGVDMDEPVEKVIKFAEDMKITYPLALDPGAEIFGLFADKNSGVTRNVIIDKKGNIAHLTRLFNMEEFITMVEKIKVLLKDDGG
ncbi:MAG: TlpA family protein disulfide reductase [Candidatus Marinimicrobia bacterium]|jgi:peroxiredoxin|nr:TlpA family protein disulfide reductase [Candidatus Neomarinimicrobiota bacterium]